MLDRDGVLILGHCGGRGIDAVAAAVHERGLNRYILTSRPLQNQARRMQKLGEIAEWIACTQEHDLTPDDLARALVDLRARGARVRCCIGAWDGNRRLMAVANQALGASDLAPPAVDRLVDKLGVRQQLAAAGLSRASAELVTESNLAALKRSGRQLFVKPVKGAASYGAFALDATTTWADLQRIALAAEADGQYRGIMSGMRFLAEDVVPGRECSFEVLVLDGRPYVLAVHEKVATTVLRTTVLENVAVAPPWNIDRAGIAAGIAWLQRVFAALAADWGCYHVEARFDGTDWDLIEINPRMGGSLISDSVAFLTGGARLLDLWLDTLLQPSAMHARLSAIAIDDSGQSRVRQGALFRSYYGRPGRIAELEQVPTDPPARLVKLYVGLQDQIPGLDREVVLAEALWVFDPGGCDAALREALLTQSELALRVRYEPDGTAP